MKNKLLSSTLIIGATGLVALVFQNCSGVNTPVSYSSSSGAPVAAAQSNAAVGTANLPGQVIGPVAPAPPADAQIYNFVAADRATCEAAVVQRLNTAQTCSLGGGCTLDGAVPSNGNPSANPTSYGACVVANRNLVAAPNASIEPRYNFVAADQATCEASITRRLGVTRRCSLNGGCSADGLNPQAGHPTANPGLYGACFALSVLNDPTVAGSAAYNFVAADAATCQASIVQRLGLQVPCTVGGGCSLDGRVPTAQNVSANPGLPGACIIANIN